MRASAGDVLVCNRDAGGAACARTSVQAFLMCGKLTRLQLNRVELRCPDRALGSQGQRDLIWRNGQSHLAGRKSVLHASVTCNVAENLNRCKQLALLFSFCGTNFYATSGHVNAILFAAFLCVFVRFVSLLLFVFWAATMSDPPRDCR